jgi:hypothetical protein
MDVKIIDLLLRDHVIDKLIWKHNISELEVRQVFNNQPDIRFIEKGKIKGEHLYPPTQKTTPACRNPLRRAGTGSARGAP